MNYRYPVLFALSAAVILVLIGIYLVEQKSSVSPTGDGGSFGAINGGYVAPTAAAPSSDTGTSLPNPSTNTGPDTLTIPAATATPARTNPVAGKKDDGTFDFNAMLAALKHDSPQGVSVQSNSTYEQLSQAFSFAPKLEVPAPKPKTPAQQAIFAYGNTIGARIQGFAAVNMNMSQIITDQVKHRTDPTYGNPVRDLGQRYKTLGEGILGIKDIPPEVENAHQALGESYVNLGVALSKIPDATDDQAFLAAITAYNYKADAFTNAYAGMAALFTALNVTFESTDPGSAFSFRHN